MENKYGNIGVIDSGKNRKIVSSEMLRLQETLKNSKLDIDLLEKYEKLYNIALLERNAYLEEAPRTRNGKNR